MPGEISAGPSRRHVLPGQAEVDQAEQLLNAGVKRGAYRPGPPPPAAEFHDPKEALSHPPPGQPVILTGPQRAMAALAALGGRKVGKLETAAPAPAPMAELPEPEDEPAEPLVLEAPMRVTYAAEEIVAEVWFNGQHYEGRGQSLSEAIGIVAGELEEGLSKPVCPTCGQVMPDSE